MMRSVGQWVRRHPWWSVVVAGAAVAAVRAVPWLLVIGVIAGVVVWRRRGRARRIRTTQAMSHEGILPGPVQPVLSRVSSAVSGDARAGFPTFDGRPLFDWVDVIAALKRDGELGRALVIADGCMKSMAAAAMQDPAYVMEFYVKQVAVIMRKLGDHQGEVTMLEDWLGLGLPAPREDYRLDLKKRLAKAQELAAKAEGGDASIYRQEWKRLVELEKQAKTSGRDLTGNGVSSGQTQLTGATHPPVSRLHHDKGGWLPSVEELTRPVFVAVDFETANRSRVSACQIALIKVADGKVVERFNTLLQPPSGHGRFEFTHLHGITAVDTIDAPQWPQVAPTICNLIAGVPVYAHNATFDAGVWQALDSHYGISTYPQRFYCTMRLAQHHLKGLANWELPTVIAACSPTFNLNHHNATSDAEACALIVHTLQTTTHH